MIAKYTGLRFSELTVTGRAGTSKDGRAIWACTCDCGVIVESTSKQLTRGHARACQLCQESGSKSVLGVRLKKYTVADDGCWNWDGKRNHNGYGVIQVGGIHTRAHRAAYFLRNPDADRALVVMHTCDNPRCINPEHLRLGTQQDNMMDMHIKGRFRGGASPGNQNAKGNKGWMKGGVTAKYVVSKLGEEVEVPHDLT